MMLAASADPASSVEGVVLVELAWVRMSAEGCQGCPLAGTRDKVVFGGVDGYRDIRADLMIVGEAPGTEEDTEGLPFVGAAGQKLDLLLAEAGLDRQSAYITNVVKCRPIKEREGRPPTNRAPEPSEIAACWNYLESQITLVGPRVIVALGVTAVARLLGPGAQVGESRGQGHFHGNIPVVATYRPSPLSLHRQPGRRAMVLDDLSLAKRLLDGQEDPLPWASPDI
jgi:uracil-DNA glycosylase family 4